MLSIEKSFRAALFSLTLAASGVWAQQNVPTPPVPPPTTSDGSSSTTDAPPAPQALDPNSQMRPDTNPLSGAARLSLGSTGRPRSYVLPTLQLSEVGDSNPFNATGASTIQMATLVSGHLMMQRMSHRSEFSLDYSGGGAFYYSNSGLDSSFHELSVGETIMGRRWTLNFTDSVTYLPLSGYGVGGGFGFPTAGSATGLTGIGSSLFNLNQSFLPNQSIFTTQSRRISNTAIGQLDYKTSARGSFTVTGNYGMLRFIDPGFVDSNSYMGQAGYNYALTARDTISVMGSATFVRFSTGSNAFHGENGLFAYGRRITGRLAFQVSAGPQFNQFKSVTGATIDTVSWHVDTSLQCQFQRGNAQISYTHYTSEGSGVLFGAYSDMVSVTLNRQLTREWTGSVIGSYSLNKPFQQNGTLISAPGYQTWTAGGTLGRPLGHYTNFFFNYSAQHQSTGACAAACGAPFLRHVFGVSLNFNFRPIALD